MLRNGVVIFIACAGVVLCVGCGARTCAPSGESGCGYPVMARPAFVSDFEGCVEAGGVLGSGHQGSTCRSADGRLFSESR